MYLQKYFLLFDLHFTLKCGDGLTLFPFIFDEELNKCT